METTDEPVTVADAREALATISHTKPPKPSALHRMSAWAIALIGGAIVATTNLELGNWPLILVVTLLLVAPFLLIVQFNGPVRPSPRQDLQAGQKPTRTIVTVVAVYAVGSVLIRLIPEGSLPWSIGAGIATAITLGLIFEWSFRRGH
ncbi:hypothetical protein [Corynebacterium cystitidis]|uniref:Uncharacterized protein n=1 Tax=Corynebacterium cystitidis DSM 20524 TaxID=1121357 RepID=A0A1H9SNF1_9CORY|nr:hypothetical protein [Corynebacterium cystitidis]WJY83091.1 hypothetical protein CCYS_10965 [Corynebacterium cystitidis DSM 20524]SER85829.1 hypothetical protein SAMN05661109_01171 [Corynebacterium cystitidis DSM 20524]SNV66130.1 Uncharacterised protein [Corynebacterium cystitidis]